MGLAEGSLPKISIIVASFNNETTIEECLRSLLAQDYPQSFLEIIVMDGVSRDSTVKKAEAFPVKVISIPLNAPAAYNYAMKIAKHPILGFVDSDAKVESQWLRKLIPHLAESKVAGVSGSIETWNTDNPWARNIGYELKNRYRRIGKYAGRIATMNLLLKRTVIEEAGGWPEDMPSQYDTELGYRISGKGYRVCYEPAAVCYHYNRPTLHAYYRQQLQYGKNTLRLYLKHGSLAKGDEITDIGMNIQPVLLLAFFASLLFGIIPLLRLLWYISAAIVAFLLFYYAVSAGKLSTRFAEASTWRLVVLYFVRSWAWFVGAIAVSLNYLFGDRRKKLLA